MKQLTCLGEIVFDVFESETRLGGAPLNVAAHLMNLQKQLNLEIKVQLHSALGMDEFGIRAAKVIESLALPPIRILAERPTGKVLVHQSPSGAHRFEIAEGCAWEEIYSPEKKGDMLVFGSLAMKSKHNRSLLDAWAQEDVEYRLCDLNIRQPFFSVEIANFCLEHANILKINDDELETLATIYEIEGDMEECIHQLAYKFGLRHIALTLGSEGAWLWNSGKIIKQEARLVKKIIDTVGAGDSFTSCLALGILLEQKPQEYLARGVQLAAKVCELRGAFPTGPDAETFYKGL